MSLHKYINYHCEMTAVAVQVSDAQCTAQLIGYLNVIVILMHIILHSVWRASVDGNPTST